MNIFIDTEFTCLPWEASSELISIGVVKENGEEYYGCSSEFQLDNCNEFVKNNVLEHLPPKEQRKTLEQMSGDLKKYLVNDSIAAVWAVFPTEGQLNALYQGIESLDVIKRNYSDWDFQLLKMLVGNQVRLPSSCSDLALHIKQLGEGTIPKNLTPHNALDDARWNLEVWKKCLGA